MSEKDYLVKKSTFAFYVLLLINLLPGTLFGEYFGDEMRAAVFLFVSSCLLLCLLYKREIGKELLASINMADIYAFLFLSYSIINSFYKIEWYPNAIYEITVTITLFFTYLTAKVLFNSGEISFREITLYVFTSLIFNIGLAVFQLLEIVPSGHSSFSITGGFFNPGPFAIYLASLAAYLMPSIYIYIKKIYTSNNPWFLILIFTASVALILYSFSRTAWVSVFFCAMLTYTTLKKRSLAEIFNSIPYKTFLLPLVIVSFIGSAIVLYALKVNSAQGRLLTWELGFSMFRDYFLTGVGSGNFGVKLAQYQHSFFSSSNPRAEQFKDIAGDVRFAFNDFLQIVCEEGIIGLGLFCGLIYCVINLSMTKIKNETLIDGKIENLAYLSSFINILITSLSSYPLNVLSIQVHFWAVAGLISASIQHRNTLDLSHKIKSITTFLFKLVFSILAFCMLFYSTIRYKAFEGLPEVEGGNIAELDQRLVFLGGSSRVLQELGDRFLESDSTRNAVSIFNVAKSMSPDKEIYFKLGSAYAELKEYGLAEDCFSFVYFSQPGLLEPKYLLAILYYDSGQTEKWIAMANEVIRFKPKIASFHSMYLQQKIHQLLIERGSANRSHNSY